MDLFDFGANKLDHNKPEYSVSEISNSLKNLVESNFNHIKVRGEISGLKIAPSGHAYFSIKDESAVLAAICWKGSLSKLAVQPEEGLEVICTGSITTYAGQSKYQLMVEKFEHAGIGALMALLAKRKADFEKEGLFEASRKKKIPKFPNIIGIITSPTGAVIKDILHRLADRMPSHVILWPSLVQGDQAAKQVVKAIEGFNKLEQNGEIKRPDVIIIARGGGSLEDLWPFNEEIVIRAVANSDIPIISAIGHETDTTLIDYVSDLRAPTPTAAAEMAVPVKAELLLKINDLSSRINNDIYKNLLFYEQKINAISKGLSNYKSRIDNLEQKFDDLSMRLNEVLPRLFENKYHMFDMLKVQLKHPKEIIENKIKNLEIFSKNLSNNFEKILDQNNYNLSALSKRLSLNNIDAKITNYYEKLKNIFVKNKYYFENYMYNRSEKLKNLNSLLNSYNYQTILERGFAIIRDESGSLIDSIDKLDRAVNINVKLKDGDKTINMK